MLSEGGVARVAEHFRRAAVGEYSWEHPLNDMADLLAIQSGQLVAFGKQSLVPLNIMTRMRSEAASEFVAIDGGNPEVNSKVRTGLSHGELVVLDEADFDTAIDRQRSPEFAAWMDRHDIGYCCVSTLIRTNESLVGLALLQSVTGPGLDDNGRRAFGLIAAAARSAVMLRETIEVEGLKLLTPALEGAGLAVAICDIAGRIRAMTPAAEELVASQRFGRVVDGKFVASDPEERTAFEDRLARAIQSWAMPHLASATPCVLSSQELTRIAVEFVPIPPEHAFNFSAAVMLIFKVPTDRASTQAGVASALFGLTATEQRVSEMLLRGLSPQKIASQTGTTIGTVRNHVHRILSKSNCRSQVEFLALMNRLD